MTAPKPGWTTRRLSAQWEEQGPEPELLELEDLPKPLLAQQNTVAALAAALATSVLQEQEEEELLVELRTEGGVVRGVRDPPTTEEEVEGLVALPRQTDKFLRDQIHLELAATVQPELLEGPE